jgi:hypothetical protein
MSQMREARARPTPMRETGDLNLAGWRDLIRGVLESRYSNRVGLLIHQYYDDRNDETIVLESRVQVPASRLDERILAEMQEDTIYEFKR